MLHIRDVVQRAVSASEVEAFGRALGAQCYETSSITGDGIEPMFFTIAKLYCDSTPEDSAKTKAKSVLTTVSSARKDGSSCAC